MNRLGFSLFVLLVAALPFEVPWAELLHGLLFRSIGSWYLLFVCGTWISIAALIVLLWRDERLEDGWQKFLLYAGIFVAVGLLAVVITSVTDTGDIGRSLQQLLFGYISPALACLVLFTMHAKHRLMTWRSFYLGWSIYLAVSMLVLWYSWNIAQSQSELFAHLSVGQKLFAWRYTFDQPWNLYAPYIGNANKTSNEILIFLLLSTAFLGSEVDSPGWVRRLYFTYWILSLLTLLILFSRAAIFLLPLIIYFSGFWNRLSNRVKWASASAIATILVVGFSSVKAILAYLLTSTYLDDASQGVLGSYNERLERWNVLWDFLLHHQQRLWYGLGTGGYGIHFYNTPEAETHNMFLDVLLESGVAGLMLLVLLLVLMALDACGYMRGARTSKVALVAIVCLVSLMTREHSVSYLYVTSLGGMCFVVIFYALSAPRESESARSINRLNS